MFESMQGSIIFLKKILLNQSYVFSVNYIYFLKRKYVFFLIYPSSHGK